MTDAPHLMTCTIAGVRCELGYADPTTAQYFRDYRDDCDYRDETGRADAAAPAIRVPYDAARVDRMVAQYPNLPRPFVEAQWLYNMVCPQLLRFRRLTFHGACVEFAGRAYIFTAYSGTGKSTHIRLWRRYLGNAVQIVNGDKPILAFPDPSPAAPGDHPILACGSPWGGKEGWQRNVQVPLAAVCMLHRGTVNAIRRASVQEALDELINRIYLTSDAGEAGHAMTMLDELITRVPVYRLDCDMSEDAVRVSFEGLTGRSYPQR